MDSNQSVFVVDDDPAARESLAALVQSRGTPVRTFTSGEDFLAAYQPSMRGCVVVDVRMTGMTGLEMHQAMLARGIPLPVIVVTGHADVPLAVRAMQAGAITLLQKPCGDNELWTAIQTALRREEEQHVQQADRDELIRRMETLSPGEMDVLRCLLQGHGNKQISMYLKLGLRTVETRRAKLLAKMKVESIAELVRDVLIAKPELADEPACRPQNEQRP